MKKFFLQVLIFCRKKLLKLGTLVKFSKPFWRDETSGHECTLRQNSRNGNSWSLGFFVPMKPRGPWKTGWRDFELLLVQAHTHWHYGSQCMKLCAAQGHVLVLLDNRPVRPRPWSILRNGWSKCKKIRICQDEHQKLKLAWPYSKTMQRTPS